MAVRRTVRRRVEVPAAVMPVVPEIAKKGPAGRVMPVMMVVMLVMAFALGSLWSKVKYLERGVGVGVGGGYGGGGTGGQQAGGEQTKPTPVPQLSPKDLVDMDLIKFGDKNSKLQFVEIADPSCPFCHAAAGKNPELSKQMGPQFTLVSDGGTYVSPVIEMRKLVDQGKASFVYVYMNGHGSGELAQKAEYCAFEKGKFWEVHDKLMTNGGYELINGRKDPTTNAVTVPGIGNDKSNAGKLADFLKGVVDSAFLKSCLDSGKYDGRIASDSQVAAGLAVSGTPGFFVNETRFGGAYSWNDMKSAAEAAL